MLTRTVQTLCLEHTCGAEGRAQRVTALPKSLQMDPVHSQRFSHTDPFQDRGSGSSARFCLGGVKGEHPALHDCSNFTADISWQLDGKVRLQCPEAGQEPRFLTLLSHSQWLRNQSEFVSLQTALPIIHHRYLQLGTSQAVTHGKHHPIPKTEALEFN